FQAEDGIRDGHVTGVQTCALPIWSGRRLQMPESRLRPHFVKALVRVHAYPDGTVSAFLGPHRLATFAADGQQISPDAPQPGSVQIGRASCREIVESGEGSGSVRET